MFSTDQMQTLTNDIFHAAVTEIGQLYYYYHYYHYNLYDLYYNNYYR